MSGTSSPDRVEIVGNSVWTVAQFFNGLCARLTLGAVLQPCHRPRNSL